MSLSVHVACAQQATEHAAHAMHVWPAMALSDHVWATMASALLSVVGMPARQATSVWYMNMKVHQQHELRGMARKWVTSGVSTYLGLMVSRKARATIYIDRMLCASMLTCSGSANDEAGNDAVYDRRAKDTTAAVTYSTSLATLKATWKTMRERKAIAAQLPSVGGKAATQALPKAKGVRRYRAMATMGRQLQAPAVPTSQKRVQCKQMVRTQ